MRAIYSIKSLREVCLHSELIEHTNLNSTHMLKYFHMLKNFCFWWCLRR